MKNKTIAVLLLIWLVAVAALIFWFSSKNGEESGDMSQNLTDEIFNFLARDEELGHKLHRFVRKSAHILEYALLGASGCIFLFFIADAGFFRLRSRRLLALCAWGGATLYAVTDEIHQIFVPGRGPSVTDVMIDALGALVGVAAVVYICRFILKGKKICKEEGGI